MKIPQDVADRIRQLLDMVGEPYFFVLEKGHEMGPTDARDARVWDAECSTEIDVRTVGRTGDEERPVVAAHALVDLLNLLTDTFR